MPTPSRSLIAIATLALLTALSLIAPALRAAEPAPATAPPTAPSENPPQVLTPDIDPAEASFTLYEENDSHWLNPFKPTDRHYTQGLEVAIGSQPQWASELAAWIPGGESYPRAAVTFVAGQLMFTPENIRLATPDPIDHPYAGYLFFGGVLQRRNAANNSLDEFQLDLGVIGPSSLAENVQIWFHKNIVDADHPSGWNSQIKDEGAVQFTFRKKWRIDLVKPAAQDTGSFGVDAIPYAGFALGTVKRNLEGGATLRVGWNLPDDFGPGRLADVADATAFRTTATGWGFFAFIRPGARLVEHDTFIGGSDFRSGPGVTQQPLVGEAQAGLNLAYRGDGWTFELTYSQTYLTKEFKTQHGTDSYGSAAANLTWQF